jgi:hypothetical protein
MFYLVVTRNVKRGKLLLVWQLGLAKDCKIQLQYFKEGHCTYYGGGGGGRLSDAYCLKNVLWRDLNILQETVHDY